MVTKQLPMRFVPGGRRYEPELPVTNRPMKPVRFKIGNFFKNKWFVLFLVIVLVLAFMGIFYAIYN